MYFNRCSKQIRKQRKGIGKNLIYNWIKYYTRREGREHLRKGTWFAIASMQRNKKCTSRYIVLYQNTGTWTSQTIYERNNLISNWETTPSTKTPQDTTYDTRAHSLQLLPRQSGNTIVQIVLNTWLIMRNISVREKRHRISLLEIESRYIEDDKTPHVLHTRGSGRERAKRANLAESQANVGTIKCHLKIQCTPPTTQLRQLLPRQSSEQSEQNAGNAWERAWQTSLLPVEWMHENRTQSLQSLPRKSAQRNVRGTALSGGREKLQRTNLVASGINEWM